VGPQVDYVLVKAFNPYTSQPCHIILAKALLGKYLKAEGENQDLSDFPAG
jgi:isoleucyl-tRNA synthetase